MLKPNFVSEHTEAKAFLNKPRGTIKSLEFDYVVVLDSASFAHQTFTFCTFLLSTDLYEQFLIQKLKCSSSRKPFFNANVFRYERCMHACYTFRLYIPPMYLRSTRCVG